MEMQSGYVLEKCRIGRVRRWLLRERNLMICFFAKKQKVLVFISSSVQIRRVEMHWPTLVKLK